MDKLATADHKPPITGNTFFLENFSFFAVKSPVGMITGKKRKGQKSSKPQSKCLFLFGFLEQQPRIDFNRLSQKETAAALFYYIICKRL